MFRNYSRLVQKVEISAACVALLRNLQADIQTTGNGSRHKAATPNRHRWNTFPAANCRAEAFHACLHTPWTTTTANGHGHNHQHGVGLSAPGSNLGLETHGVNNGEALKEGAVRFRLSHNASDPLSSHTRMDLLDKYHGAASGIFSCDEHLAGLHPSHGTELCTVVEAMSVSMSTYPHSLPPS